LPDFKLRKEQPDFGEGEVFVGDDIQTSFVYVPGSLYIPVLQLLIQGIVYPKVNIPTPVSLLLQRKHRI
jgi:hypothetical protein